MGGNRSDNVPFEKPGSSKKVTKRSRGCYEVISLNEGIALTAAKHRHVITVSNKCEGKAYIFALPSSKELT